MGDLISVIIPVYKVEKYLKRCVNSVLKQSYQNLEIILVNDGSPDRCGVICDEIAMMDDRVKVIHKKNGGLSDARNAGIKISKGDYLAFIDSDDWVDKEYFKKLYHLIITTESDIASCNYLKTDNDKICVSQEVESYNFTNIEALEQLTGRFYSQLVLAWGKIYKRSLFDEIRFPLGKIHEDEFVIHHLLYKANKIAVTTEQLYFYYQRNDSIMGEGFNLKGRFHAAQAFEDRAKLFNELGLVKSRDHMYRMLFHIYRQIIEYENININEEYTKKKIMKKYNNLRVKLRRGDIGLKEKFFYELYYLMPNLMKEIYGLYRKLISYN